jgi:hypothetical protein
MPDHHITLTDAEHALLDRVRRAQGLNTLSDAVEWLTKSSLRRNAERITGRRRGPRLATLGGKPQ